MSRSHALVLLTCLAALLALGALSVHATESPIRARGYQPSKVYDLGELDSVNRFNGNLTLALPIGGSYPVGGGFSYSLSLVYNSTVWDFDVQTGCNPDCPIASPGAGFNAGLGWQLTLGELRPPYSPANSTQNWVYLAADGSEHSFFPNLHGNDVKSQAAGVSYTRNSSYLRLVEVSPSVREVHHPDGSVHRFIPAGAAAGDSWRLTSIRDTFGNQLSVSYGTTTNGASKWTLSDGHRQHFIHFEPSSSYYNEVIDKVELEVFAQSGSGASGGRSWATYDFSYTNNRVIKPCPHEDQDLDVTVPLLISVTRPDGTAYLPGDYAYIHQGFGTGLCNDPRVGKLGSLTLPTGGRIEWDYDYWELATDPEALPFTQGNWGVVARRVIDPTHGQLDGDWTFTPRLDVPPSPSPPGSGQQDSRELTVTVVDPLGHQTEHFFSVFSGGINPSPSFDADEFGLPLSHYEADDTGTRFLSTRTTDSAGTLLRSTYVRYEGGSAKACPGFAPKCSYANARVASTRTVFHDDGPASTPRHADVTFSDFDGLGHYRTATTGGNFDAGNVRTTTTRFNPNAGTYTAASPGTFTPPAKSAPWLIGLFDRRTVSEGGASIREEYCHDASTGFLQRHRRLRSGTTRSPSDLVTVYSADIDGNLAGEASHGGDSENNLPTGDGWCTAGLGAAEFELRYENADCGVRTKAVFVDAADNDLPFLVEHQDVDCASGLVQRVYDSAGLWADLEYDRAHRRTVEKPGGPAGVAVDGWTQYTWTNYPSEVQITQYAGSNTTSNLFATGLRFDGFGRVERERRLMPPGIGHSQQWSTRFTAYNALGNRTSVSTWNRQFQLTQFRDYDPFGRPQTLRNPDGSETKLDYDGVGKVVRLTDIATGRDAQGNLLTTRARRVEVYDRQGRLWQAREQSVASTPELETTQYSYDPAGRLTKVIQGIQTRRFLYDGAGLLTSERHPELGASGGGLIVYPSYNSRGQLLRRRDGETGPNTYSRDLSYLYDRAGRLLRVSDTVGGALHKEWIYAGQQTSTDRRLGKLIRAVRHNRVRNIFVPGSTDLVTLPVTEEFTYAGRGGRVSQRSTTLPAGTGDYEWQQGWSYDGAGRVVETDYPACQHDVCSRDTGAAELRSVEQVWNQALIEEVQDAAGSSYATLSYRLNGTLQQVAHGNGVVETHEEDPQSQARPLRVFTTAATQNWDSGLYAYDGGGNVTRMGLDSFVYDEAGRLADARQWVDGVEYQQSYLYDNYGNRTLTTTKAGGLPSQSIGLNVNIASNRISSSQVAYDEFGSQTTWGSQSWEYDTFDQIRNSGAKAYLYTADDERVWVLDASDGGGAGLVEHFYLRDLDGKLLREYRVGQPALPPNASASIFADRFETADLSCWSFVDNGAGPIATDLDGPAAGCGGRGWTIERDYVYAGSRLLAAETPSGRQHFTLDHLGSPRLVTGEGGETLARHVYYPYGEEITVGSEERLKFTGHERDLGGEGTADDLDYMHARYYQPGLGRFLSVDPVRSADPVLPQSWNRYAYVLGNPLILVDPDGEEPKVYLLATGKRFELTRHAALYIRDPVRNLDLVYSNGGQTHGVHNLKQYLDSYGDDPDNPTFAAELQLDEHQTEKLMQLLGATIQPGSLAPEEGRYGIIEPNYSSISHNCAQYCFGVINQTIADDPEVLVFRISLGNGEGMILTTNQLIRYLQQLALLGRLQPVEELEEELDGEGAPK